MAIDPRELAARVLGFYIGLELVPDPVDGTFHIDATDEIVGLGQLVALAQAFQTRDVTIELKQTQDRVTGLDLATMWIVVRGIQCELAWEVTTTFGAPERALYRMRAGVVIREE